LYRIIFISLPFLFAHERKQCERSGTLDFPGDKPLMLGTGSGDAPGKYFAPFRSETTKRIGIFVIYIRLADTDFADLPAVEFPLGSSGHGSPIPVSGA
jgi:hypothetical protein